MSSFDKTVKSQLQSIGQAIARFMVHRPQPSQPSARSSSLTAQRSCSEKSYSEKSSLYPYLPSTEEQRDWLEQIYSIQSP